MKTLLVIFLLGLFKTICYSQTDFASYNLHNSYLGKGDYYLDKKDYKKALVYYDMAFLEDNQYSILLRKAEAFKALKLYDQAAECYRLYFKYDPQALGEHNLKYALLLLKNKNIKGFEKSIVDYNEYVRGEMYDYTFGKDVRLKMYKDTTIAVIENESILNTAQSEISPVIYKNKLVFASTRRNLTGSKENDHFNLFSVISLSDGQLGRLNKFNRSLNSNLNESSISFSNNTNNIYITKSASTNTNLKSYITTIPVDLNDRLDIKEFSIEGFSNIGHISFNSNGTTMYFVSETADGNGSGLDIYFSNLVEGKWSKPENIGKNINSGKDEMYPYVLNDTMLFFSSAGHNGFGGLDLYSVNLNQNNSSPKNLGSKVNSKYDDYGLSFVRGGLTGYFCSNRPGGFGKEDIYRLHLVHLKIKKIVNQYKALPEIEDDKINLYLSDGEEYNIAAQGGKGFDFSFLPQEIYHMIIRHENPLATNVIMNEKLTPEQKARAFLKSKPFEKTKIKLNPGMKYQFTVGDEAISNEYRKALTDMSKDYKKSSINTIDLTALARQLLIEENEIYTIHFKIDENQTIDSKNKEVTSLFINNQKYNISEKSFFFVLPLDIEESFNIKTDLDHFKEAFSPKKVGRVRIDDKPVIEEKPIIDGGWPIIVNTESLYETGDRILAEQFSIIPGTFYIFSLTKNFTGTDKKLEIFVPLTKGVKYNLGSRIISENKFNETLSEMKDKVGGLEIDEELIDISILSKELDISPKDSIVFSIMPVKQKGTKTFDAKSVNSLIDIDGMKYYIPNNQKLYIQLILKQNKKVNIQTDLEYVKEKFEPSTITLNIDSTSYTSNIAEESKNMILDPVFDVIIVNFDLNEYSIRSDAISIIEDKVIQILKGDSRLYVTIKGYTDPLGDAAYNEELSKNRAQSVKDFLAANGIGENRIRTFSFGETESLKDGVNWEDLNEEELEKYRKVEIAIYLPR